MFLAVFISKFFYNVIPIIFLKVRFSNYKNITEINSYKFEKENFISNHF